jgi:hypothetical protein
MPCSDCKYWDKSNFDNFVKIGECVKPKAFWDCTSWDENYDNRILKPECENMKMFVQDGSDYTAHLYTTPDFNCSEFEIKNV